MLKGGVDSFQNTFSIFLAFTITLPTLRHDVILAGICKSPSKSNYVYNL